MEAIEKEVGIHYKTYLQFENSVLKKSGDQTTVPESNIVSREGKVDLEPTSTVNIGQNPE